MCIIIGVRQREVDRMFLSEKEYGHAVAVLSGKVEKTPFFAEVEQWFKNAFRLQLYVCSSGIGAAPGR